MRDQRPLLLWCKTDPPPAGVGPAGWQVLHAPTHRLARAPRSAKLDAALGIARRATLWIFVSRAAVRAAGALELFSTPVSARCFAVGPATAAALAEHGAAAAHGHRADSEGLLAHADLQRVAGLDIALFCARGGRELLEHELGQRGARVTPIHVYQRRCVRWSTSVTTALHEAARIVVVVASAESARAAAERLPALERVQWIVPSARIAATLPALGAGAIAVAERADDTALLQASLRVMSGSIPGC